MIVITALLSTTLFFFAFRLSGIYKVALGIISLSQQALKTMTDSSIDEEKKERQIREISVHLLTCFVKITLLSIFVLGLPALLVLAFDVFDIIQSREVIGFLLRLDVMIILLVCMIVASRYF